MQHFSVQVLAFGVLVVSATQVWSQNTNGPKTREQVRIELMDAIRTGDLPANDETGRMLNEVNPSAYPPKPSAACKTREQVRAELADAHRTGNLPASHDSGCMHRNMHPHRDPKR